MIRTKRLILRLLVALATIYLVCNIWPDNEENTAPNEVQKTCQKKTKVGFLKTHKCASTSVQNILLRFALNNSLNVVLPNRFNYLGKHGKYQRDMIANTPWEKAGLEYDIFCLHGIWNQEAIDDTLGPGATYITIVRDPVDLYESLWHYAGLSDTYRMSLEEFAVAPKSSHLQRRRYNFLGRNQMLWDMGMKGEGMNNMNEVHKKIQQIDDRFGLVLIAEKLQESLILMKDLLCWDYKDIINLKLNARDDKSKSKLNDTTRQALKNYLAADYVLYDHFKEKFMQQLEAFGHQRMERELDILSRENSNFQKNCGLVTQGKKDLYGEGILGYSTNSKDNPQCRYMTISEIEMMDLLRAEQTKRAIQG